MQRRSETGHKELLRNLPVQRKGWVSKGLIRMDFCCPSQEGAKDKVLLLWASLDKPPIFGSLSEGPCPLDWQAVPRGLVLGGLISPLSRKNWTFPWPPGSGPEQKRPPGGALARSSCRVPSEPLRWGPSAGQEGLCIPRQQHSCFEERWLAGSKAGKWERLEFRKHPSVFVGRSRNLSEQLSSAKSA